MLLKECYQQFKMDIAPLDARLLICHALGMSHEAFIMHAGKELSNEDVVRIEYLIAQRKTGKPVAKIIGQKEFYGRLFQTTEDTLDPRPDSEVLIEAVLKYAGQGTRILDLGTGTGCLVLTLLAEVPQSSGVAVDCSEKALAVARINAENLHLDDRVTFMHGDWFDSITEQFDVIISNPPYIPSGDISYLDKDVRDYDPMSALDGGIDGLDPYRIIIPQSHDFLKQGGLLAFEVGIHQASDVASMMSNQGFRDVRVIPDLAGISRVVRGIR